MPATKSSVNLEDDKETRSVKRHESSYMFLAKDEALESSNESTIISLTHPRFNKKTKYLHDSEHNKLYEIVSFDEPFRSWFIGDYVKSDGKLYLSTPIDPLFIVIPLLQEHCVCKAIPLEDLLSNSSDERLKDIIDCIGDLNCIADLKGPSDLKAYKYNPDKTLEWLEKKVRKVANVLKRNKIHVKPGAVAETFVTSEKETENIDEEYYLRYAHGIVSEYLQEELSALLEKKFNFKPDIIESLSNKRKSQQALNISQNSETNEENDAKKIKSDEDNVESKFFSTVPKNVKPVKTPTISSKEKAKQKAASGTKSIFSFFSKK